MPIIIVVIILIIIAIGYYILNKPRTIYRNIDYGPDEKSEDISIKSKPINYSYNTIYPSGIWAIDPAGTVTCPNAPGVNLVGDNKNYCIFDNRGDVINYCNAEKDCQGYVHINDVYQVATKWGTDNDKNGELVLKQIDVKSMIQ